MPKQDLENIRRYNYKVLFDLNEFKMIQDIMEDLHEQGELNEDEHIVLQKLQILTQRIAGSKEHKRQREEWWRNHERR